MILIHSIRLQKFKIINFFLFFRLIIFILEKLVIFSFIERENDQREEYR